MSDEYNYTKSVEEFRIAKDRTIRIRVEEWDVEYCPMSLILEDETDKVTHEIFVDVEFQTPTCKDGVWVSTSQVSWLPDEIRDRAAKFDAFVKSLVLANAKLQATIAKEIGSE